MSLARIALIAAGIATWLSPAYAEQPFTTLRSVVNGVSMQAAIANVSRGASLPSSAKT